MKVAVVNTGSSSIKLRVIGADDGVEFSRDLSSSGSFLEDEEVRQALADAGEVDAVGHRVVHGGSFYTHSVVADDEVVRRLEELVELAPLHQPRCLQGIEAARGVWPDAPAVACFDTAFHTNLPAAASTYALPAEWRDGFGIRRYGFHGLSHSYAARRACELAGLEAGGARAVTCHLGAGASLAAVVDGRSVATTMGFTPLEGLVMATRSGSIDPGALIWLQQHRQVSVDELAQVLEARSGLLGLAGTADMAEVLRRAQARDEDALLAMDVYVHRLAEGIAAMTAAMHGLDVVVFTGGVGENSPEVRRRTAASLGFLGALLDERTNEEVGAEGLISDEGSAVAIAVVTSREDLEIARETRGLLTGQAM